MTTAKRRAAAARQARRGRHWSNVIPAILIILLVGALPLWLLAGRVELSELAGSTVGEIAVSAQPTVRFVGAADGLRWVDVRARPAESAPAAIRTTLIDERQPERPVARWTVTLTGPGPVWMEMPPIARSAGVPYRVVVEPAAPEQPEVFLRLVLDREGQPIVAVQRFYRVSPLTWLVVMGSRLSEAGTLIPVLVAGGALMTLFCSIFGLLLWRFGWPGAPSWTLVGLLAAAWGVVAIHAAASAQLWAQLTVAWPDG
ncbi:MAG: hypothetical protein RMM58_08815 [Chloroflexota bacterium]|nr:hypothetical protein [Dehalococcoidia bacterium]MDW8253966.1 hypothetical protein [Chloroflexota bacterium]